MTAATSGARFEIKIDGVVRTYRDLHETAIYAARFFFSSAIRAPSSPSLTCGTDRPSRSSGESYRQPLAAGINYNVEEWFEGDCYETLATIPSPYRAALTCHR